MPRYALVVEYDGTPFVGWQRQPDALSIQGVIEDAIFKFSGEEVTIRGAGRTDAGSTRCTRSRISILQKIGSRAACAMRSIFI